MKTPLEQWVIYFNPKDYPGKFVVRRWAILPSPVPLNDLSLHEDLESARSALPEGLFCLPRFPKDDPVIVEVWL